MKTMRGFAMLKIGETGWVTKGFRPAVRRTPSVDHWHWLPCTSDVHPVWAGPPRAPHDTPLGRRGGGGVVGGSGKPLHVAVPVLVFLPSPPPRLPPPGAQGPSPRRPAAPPVEFFIFPGPLPPAFSFHGGGPPAARARREGGWAPPPSVATWFPPPSAPAVPAFPQFCSVFRCGPRHRLGWLGRPPPPPPPRCSPGGRGRLLRGPPALAPAPGPPRAAASGAGVGVDRGSGRQARGPWGGRLARGHGGPPAPARRAPPAGPLPLRAGGWGVGGPPALGGGALALGGAPEGRRAGSPRPACPSCLGPPPPLRTGPPPPPPVFLGPALVVLRLGRAPRPPARFPPGFFRRPPPRRLSPFFLFFFFLRFFFVGGGGRGGAGRETRPDRAPRRGGGALGGAAVCETKSICRSRKKPDTGSAATGSLWRGSARTAGAVIKRSDSVWKRSPTLSSRQKRPFRFI